jgi:hydrogenase-4 component B
LVVAALLTLGVAGWLVRGQIGWPSPAILALCGVGGSLAFAEVVGAAPPGLLHLPVGLPGSGMDLALDGLSGFFLLLLFVLASAASAFVLHQPEERTAPFLPVLIAGMAFTLLAGDAFTLLLALGLMSLACWALVLTHCDDDQVRDAALLHIGIASFGAISMIGALALLAPNLPSGFPGLGFAAMRTAPPDGWRAIAVLILVLLGAGSTAGLVPLHVSLPPAHAAAPSHVSALLSGAMTNVALYVLIRVLFDLVGRAQPGWWGVPLLIIGAGSAVLGALRANLEPDMKSVLACSTIGYVGLIVIGLGVALIARGADLIPLASLALAAALLLALAHGLFTSLLFLAAGAVHEAADTNLLHRLGGLIRGMPVTTACVLAGAAGMAALPPGPGFAGIWLLFQSVLAGPRIAGLSLQIMFAVVAALIALAVGLAATAAVRLVGVAFLGRPRIPRTAAAEEVGRSAQASMIGLAILAMFVGLFPGSVLALAGPALRRLLDADITDRIGVLTMAAQAGGAGYSPLAITALLALAGAGAIAAWRLRGVRGERRAPTWESGFAAPPPWLPFGDPATQYGAASFSHILRRVLGGPVLEAREFVERPHPGETAAARVRIAMRDPAEPRLFAPLARLTTAASLRLDALHTLTVRRALAVMFVALVLFLAALAWVESL